MYYIEDQDPILVKNEVLLDQDALRKLYQEITLKFGQYVHKSYDGSLGPYGVTKHIDADYQYIKNYSETKKEDGSGLTHYEYDEFMAPELTKCIMRLIEGDATAIDEIKKGPTAAQTPRRDGGQQRQLHKELQELLNSSPGDMDQEKFKQLTEEIQRFYQGEQDEELLKDLQEYYQKVLACVKFKPVMTLYKDKLNEFRRIYNDVKAFYQGTAAGPCGVRGGSEEG